MNDNTYKPELLSKQTLKTDEKEGNYIKPWIDYDDLHNFFYYNVYHQRCLKLKAKVLSNIDVCDFDKRLPMWADSRNFLYNFVLGLETFGTSFIEKCGTDTDYFLYNIPAHQGRLNLNGDIFQKTEGKAKKLNGFFATYGSLKSRVYGEPDYLPVLEQIDLTKMADVYNQKFFINGARPGYAVIFENSSPNEEQKTAFKEFFGGSFKGFDNSHKTLLAHTGKNADGSPAKIRLEEMGKVADISFKTLKEVTRDEIIAAHSVPPRLVGVASAATLGGSGEASAQLHSFNELEIKPKMKFLEEFFLKHDLKLKIKKFDTTSLKEDASFMASLVQSGIYEPAEAREKLDL
ncbi:MAG: portal protein [Gammaproteobacteria bacterium]|nr:MAG: portal protein [Gammaproteobacteria bacterium]